MNRFPCPTLTDFTGKDSYVRPTRTPPPHVGRTEQRDGRNAKNGGQMGYAGIMADIKTGLRENAGNCEQIGVPEDCRQLLDLIANQHDHVLISRSLDQNRNIPARL